MVVMPINKLILNVFWGQLSGHGCRLWCQHFPETKLSKKTFLILSNGIRKFIESPHFSLGGKTADGAGYGLRHTSLGDSHVIPIFSVAKNLNVNKTFSRDVKAWFLIESEDSSFLIKQSLCHWQRNQAWAS